MAKICLAEYLWLDGAKPTRDIRSKSRIVNLGDNPKVEDFPEWSFDGSSTEQADGNDSDCLLKPVSFVKDPLREKDAYLVMCEVLNADGSVHKTNSRAVLREVLEAGAASQEPWIGFEQEYTLFKNKEPLGWPQHGYPAPQGPYYCGAGASRVSGRELVEEHFNACIDAGIIIYGINAEVMPGQWEFQVGYRGIEGEACDVLTVSDHTWFARYILSRLSEKYDIDVSFDNKPIKGDWNGAGMHTNFSTSNTRAANSGIDAISSAVQALEGNHDKHIVLYGANLHERLTGLHETCDINTFKSGVADRGSSIRIPQPVQIKGSGYFEDRRPGANADPYLVAARLCATVCGVEDSTTSLSSWSSENSVLSEVA